MDFTDFNANEAALEASGLRVFGPNVDTAGHATLAADVELEYVTVSADGTTAWITICHMIFDVADGFYSLGE